MPSVTFFTIKIPTLSASRAISGRSFGSHTGVSRKSGCTAVSTSFAAAGNKSSAFVHVDSAVKQSSLKRVNRSIVERDAYGEKSTDIETHCVHVSDDCPIPYSGPLAGYEYSSTPQ